jgi:hypothetical protein
VVHLDPRRPCPPPCAPLFLFHLSPLSPYPRVDPGERLLPSVEPVVSFPSPASPLSLLPSPAWPPGRPLPGVMPAPRVPPRLRGPPVAWPLLARCPNIAAPARPVPVRAAPSTCHNVLNPRGSHALCRTFCRVATFFSSVRAVCCVPRFTARQSF